MLAGHSVSPLPTLLYSKFIVVPFAEIHPKNMTLPFLCGTTPIVVNCDVMNLEDNNTGKRGQCEQDHSESLLLHPSTSHSIRSAVTAMKSANTILRRFLSIMCARCAPAGAISTEAGAISTKPSKFT